jgi:hypothetical protein
MIKNSNSLVRRVFHQFSQYIELMIYFFSICCVLPGIKLSKNMGKKLYIGSWQLQLTSLINLAKAFDDSA